MEMLTKIEQDFVSKTLDKNKVLILLLYAVISIRITSIQMLILLVMIYDLQIHQINVKIFLLNVELKEKIYMEQPTGFAVPVRLKKVCEVVKSNYGLKQAPK